MLFVIGHGLRALAARSGESRGQPVDYPAAELPVTWLQEIWQAEDGLRYRVYSAPAAPLAYDAGQARMLIEEARAWFPVSESPEDPGRLDLREIPFWRPAFRTAVPMEGQVCGHLVLYLPREVVREGGKWVALPPQLVPFIGINVARGEETRMVHVRTNRPGCPETAVRPDEDPNKVLRELYGESVRALPLGATVRAIFARGGYQLMGPMAAHQQVAVVAETTATPFNPPVVIEVPAPAEVKGEEPAAPAEKPVAKKANRREKRGRGVPLHELQEAARKAAETPPVETLAVETEAPAPVETPAEAKGEEPAAEKAPKKGAKGKADRKKAAAEEAGRRAGG